MPFKLHMTYTRTYRDNTTKSLEYEFELGRKKATTSASSQSVIDAEVVAVKPVVTARPPLSLPASPVRVADPLALPSSGYVIDDHGGADDFSSVPPTPVGHHLLPSGSHDISGYETLQAISNRISPSTEALVPAEYLPDRLPADFFGFANTRPVLARPTSRFRRIEAKTPGWDYRNTTISDCDGAVQEIDFITYDS